MTKPPSHPMQPLVWADDTIRFKENKLVSHLLAIAPIDLNMIEIMAQSGMISREDSDQFLQLIGYSVSGYGDLSRVNKNIVRLADELAEAMVIERATT